MATPGDPDDMDDDEAPQPSSSLKGPLAVTLAGALLGTIFAAESTFDFMQHLDRQVHAIHCSFLPGASKELAESGCRAVMMSPYSSFFRESLWGGIPISLWALAVFAFLAYRSGLLLWRGKAERGETRFLVAAAALPVLMSVIFGSLSVAVLDTTCKVCIGIYVSSALCFAGAVVAHRRLSAFAAEPTPLARFPSGLAEGSAFVALLTVTYLLFTPRPDAKASMAGCGWLVQPADSSEAMIPLPSARGGTSSIEVLDPLCPSCKAFDSRLAASSLRGRLDLKAVLFPLDPKCNWMVTEAVHPGACAVSEAVLCAAGLEHKQKDGEAAQRVLEWAFKNQQELRELATKDETALRSKLERQFPKVKGCLGGAVVKSRLTKGLRWAVANALPVLTPQLFVAESRMCDEDTDLGLEYTLARMLSPQAEQERARRRAAQPPPPPPRPNAPVAARQPAAAKREVEPTPAEEPATAEEPTPEEPATAEESAQ